MDFFSTVLLATSLAGPVPSAPPVPVTPSYVSQSAPYPITKHALRHLSPSQEQELQKPSQPLKCGPVMANGLAHCNLDQGGKH